MKKIICFVICAIFIITLIPKSTFAEDITSFTVISSTNNTYTYRLDVFSDYQKNAYIGKSLKKYKLLAFAFKGDNCNSNFVIWDDENYIITEGEQSVTATCNLNREDIKLTIYLYGIKYVNPDSDDVIAPTHEPTPTVEPEIPVEPLALTASTLVLSPETSFDINLENKEEKSSYSWTSSETEVATINSKGVVKAIDEGTTTIKCKETTPEGDTTTLTAIVKVKDTEDNQVTLSDINIDLYVGDSYDIDSENVPSGSRIKYSTTDKSIIKANTSNGKLVALKSGTCQILCTITTKKKEVYVLLCDVEVSK